MRYAAYMQTKRSGHTMIHVLDLPGCIAQGNTPEEAKNRLPRAIAEYLAWLREYGETVPPEGEPIAFDIVERNPSTVTTGLVGFYEPERMPITEDEVERFLSLMAHSRDTLLHLVRGVPDSILDARPLPRVRTIREILRHIANAEHWYLTRIWHDVPRLPPRRNVFDRLALVRELAVRRLCSMTAEDRSRVVAAEDGELWSARKVFRRFLEHEREHIEEIAERLRPSGRFVR